MLSAGAWHEGCESLAIKLHDEVTVQHPCLKIVKEGQSTDAWADVWISWLWAGVNLDSFQNKDLTGCCSLIIWHIFPCLHNIRFILVVSLIICLLINVTNCLLIDLWRRESVWNSRHVGCFLTSDANMKLLSEVRGRGLVSVGLQGPNLKLTNFFFFL